MADALSKADAAACVDDFVEDENKRRILTISLFMLTGGLAFIAFGVLSLFEHQTLRGALEIAVACFAGLTVAQMRLCHSSVFASYFVAIVTGAFFLYLLLCNGVYHTGWTFGYPLATMFLLGTRRGLAANGVFLFLAFCVFALSPATWHVSYPRYFEMRYVGAYVTVALLAYFFESTRIRFQNRLTRKNGELHDALDQLRTISGALRESEAKYRELVERANDGIAILQDGNIVFANDQAAAMVGCSREEVVNAKFILFVYPDERERVADYYRARLSGKHVPSVYPSALQHHSGARVDVEINSGLVTYNGAPATLIMVRNVTERLQLESQLRMAQKMEAIGQLAGGVAHDFNNMIGAITGYADLIVKKFGPSDPSLQRYATVILETSRRAADLTTKLLAYARKGKYEMAPVDIHSTVQDAIKLLEHTIDKRITITQRLKAHHTTVKGDRTQLQNAVLNLAVNARDAMPGGGELTFATSCISIDDDSQPSDKYVLPPGQYIAVEVIDTGDGISPDVQQHIFEPFFTTKAPGKGTGLGLASVYGTVKSHHGAIEVISEEGKGACFKMYLPLVADVKSVRSEEGGSPQKGSGRVLVIDDEEALRQVCVDILVELGYDVATCHDGREALEYYREHKSGIDLVLMDVVMPHVNGYDCFRGLRKIDPSVKVVIMSGFHVIDGEARRILNEGALAFIQKPFNITVLSKVLADALEKKPADRAS